MVTNSYSYSMIKKTIYLVTMFYILSIPTTFAFQPKEITSYFNGPTVSNIEATSVGVSLSKGVLNDLTEEEKQSIYFEVSETHLVCIMIYPTPASCLPKKTTLGMLDATISSLKPNTTYTVVYKRDNTIRCIKAPCPVNSFESLSTEFTTKALLVSTTLTENLRIGSRGDQVVLLQSALIKEGYLKYRVTGYFGVMTLRAVKDFQRDHFITPTGFVGVLTRGALAKVVISSPVGTPEETFEGTITAYSTTCFSDGVCSISVDGKKVVTTIGRSQEVLGEVRGIADFSMIEGKIGSHAKVYAKKTTDGYTLYGSKDYYLQVQ